MTEVYGRTNSEDRAFNCEDLLITEEILEELEEAVETHNLNEEASGFFWGSFNEEHYDQIKMAIEIVKPYVLEGEKVYYYAWY